MNPALILKVITAVAEWLAKGKTIYDAIKIVAATFGLSEKDVKTTWENNKK